ncbi:hypothetical protein HME9302_01627 [Alteripontixanthobacter maritimus]|uniref:Molybdopterin synthase sulfur carrier subunit n=1 Tax=Alteripontixanthobacter maritimus TaxID=2161824 RepID=A0A369Q7R2_9SPHN|nr:MoaD/ThiS family protein [Alteripontixanthobacter maritimus]RDC60420.1 hypothetical protein HME9302_01627 [Alteripontixanthobacter maritimus]
MAITILFLGPLRDLATSDSIAVDAPLDWAGLIAAVPDAVASELRGERVNIACAGRVLADKTTLAAVDGDEIALLPPVSGG